MRLDLANGRAVRLRVGEGNDRRILTEHYRALAHDPDAVFFPMPGEEAAIERWLGRCGYFDFDRNVHWLALDDTGNVAADLFVRRTDLPSIGLAGIGQVFLAVHREYRAAGLGGRMLGHLRTVLRDRLVDGGIRRLTGHVFPENRASLAIVSKAGFQVEGILRQHLRGADGHFHDMVVVGCLLIDAPCPACALHAEALGARAGGLVT